MIKEISYKNKKWIYASHPTKDELHKLASSYEIHPVIAEELAQPTLRPKVERFAHFLYLILHFPVFYPEKHTSLGAEIDFVIGKDFLLTVSYEHNLALEEFFESLEKNQALKEHFLGQPNVGILLHALLSNLYEFALRELDHIKLKIDEVDAGIIKKENETTVKEIFFLRRDILNFRRAIKPHETAIDSLQSHGGKFFGPAMQPYLQDIVGEYYKVWNMLENHKETIEALYDTSISDISLRSNEIMKRLTLMAFVTFPLTLIAAIFSMNITPDEFLGKPYDFIIVSSVILFAILYMLYFFKRRKWF